MKKENKMKKLRHYRSYADEVNDRRVILNTFANPVPYELVSLLSKEEEWFANKLSKELGMIYSYLSRIIKKLEEIGLIESKKKNRIKIINLTEKGKKLAKELNEIKNLLNLDEENGNK